MRLLTLVITCMLASCSKPTVGKIENSVGEELEVIKLRYTAKPVSSYEYLANTAAGELRIEVLDRFGDIPNYKIKEFTWTEGSFNMTYFFHELDEKWVVFDTTKWHKDVIF